MCGINGFNFEDLDLLKAMNNKIYYRGPDQDGFYVDKVSLGHKRLSIIDLSENGRQPMCNENKDIWIIFNGEIYNFEEVKTQLKEKHDFRSKSDTEIILHAYEEWGEECVKKFNGMWAFCIYDKKKNLLFLSRDRMGKKPLHYYLKDNKFIFGSEIKALFEHNIKKSLNKKAVSSFLSYRYVLGEETFFENVFKLMPAHNLIFDLKTNKIIKNYEFWDLIPKEQKIKEAEAEKLIDDLLNKSVNYRKISDVPLGVILSGGLDSSLITAMLAKNEKNQTNTFTVKFKEAGFDETEYAKMVSKQYNTNYYEVELDTDNFLDVMKQYTKFKDEPIGVPNEIALYLLSKKIKEKVTVVLSGEGADEAFEGYGRIFSSARDYEIIKKLIAEENGKVKFENEFSSLYKKYEGKLFGTELEHFLFMYKYWTESEKNMILLEDAKKDYSYLFKKYIEKYNIPYEKKISYLFFKLHLPGLLNRLDNPTMASSIEGRAPFLDYNVVETAFNLPLEFKTHWNIEKDEIENLNSNCDELSEIKNTSKYILKKISEKYLPKEIINRKKQGFPLPLDKWFKGEFNQIAKSILLDENAKIKSVIDQKKLKEWIESRIKIDDTMYGQKIWMLLSLEIWLREWL